MSGCEDFLRQVPLFAGLADEDLTRLCAIVEEVRLAAGEELFAEGSCGNRAYVLQAGEVEIVKSSAGREVLLAVQDRPGEMIGEMALLQAAPRMASVRARRDSLLLALRHDQLDRLLNTSPSAARAMLQTVLSRWRNTEALLRQSEKMAQLGTLSAGVAHELNNPAAAIQRGADQLQQAMACLESAHLDLGLSALTEAQRDALQALAEEARQQALRPTELEGLDRSDREYAIDTWLTEHGVENGWELAPTLVDLDYRPDRLEALTQSLPMDQLAVVVGWLGAMYTVSTLLNEIGQGAGRISEIVKALKSYAYLDQAPVQSVDVHEGLDNTLIILRNKLKAGIRVRREYAPNLPKIEAYGSELNQVWTNILDNAADAMNGQGEIVIRTRTEDERMVVEIEDNGPGIPPAIQGKIFDPFFTTKPPGKGTGLGLNISYNIIVQKHRGDITVESRAGRTCFRIVLPLTRK